MRIEEVRTGLVGRLRGRRGEIEQAAITRVYAVSDPKETSDPEYMEGLRAAIVTALDYGIAALERSEERSPPIPVALLSQARLAARNRVSLDTVMRRYFAGYTLLGDFVIDEAERIGLGSGDPLKRLLRVEAGVFDGLLTAITEEYNREAQRPGSSEERRREWVQRLLAGQLLDTSELAYDFDAWHLGIVASGPQAQDAVETLATALDSRLLRVSAGESTVWAWLGSRRGFDHQALADLDMPNRQAGLSLAFGEPGLELPGWRLTHRQAKATLPVALRHSEKFVRYADVPLLAAIIQDDLLVTSLHQLYLAPLQSDRDGGELARKTLRAYFAAGRNVSSAAAQLGVRRHTVTKRLRAVEEQIGRPLDVCSTELDTTLRLEDLDQSLFSQGCISDT
jgi:hypothetical protein